MSPLTFLHFTEAVEALPFNTSTHKAVIQAWGSDYGLTKREAHDAVRIALSGRDSGPDLYAMMLVMGRDRVLNRLHRFTEHLAKPIMEEIAKDESMESAAL